MSQQLADNFLPTTTGYDLGSPTQEWDAYIQDFTCSGTALFSGTLAITSLEGVPFADQQTGATVRDKIDTALATATNVVVFVPSTMGAGTPTSLPAGKSILDFRGGVPQLFLSGTGTAFPALQFDETNGTTVFNNIAFDTAGQAQSGTIRLKSIDNITSRNAGDTADLNVASHSGNVLVLGDTAGCSMSGSLVIAGALSGVTALSMSGTFTTSAQIVSTLATGTAPLSITSTTVVPNLSVARINSVVVSGAASAGYILQASSASAASWVASNPSSTILDKQDVIAAKTGDSTDKVIYTYSMPSGTMAAGKGIRITFYGLHNSGSAAVTYQVWFGATSVSSIIGTASTNQQQWVHAMVFNNTGSTTAQWAEGRKMESDTPAGPVATSPAENTNSGSPIVIKATFNVANTDQVTGKGWLVELIT